MHRPLMFGAIIVSTYKGVGPPLDRLELSLVAPQHDLEQTRQERRR
jgi:hypothetical protein